MRQSGQWAGKTPIAKAGNALLRKSLYLPAMVAKRHNPIIASFCDRLLARGTPHASSGSRHAPTPAAGVRGPQVRPAI
ncbi:transposase [Acidithiobacillus ferrooxidans]|nr:transposase [Acidithiobacillus ferrooxidans]